MIDLAALTWEEPAGLGLRQSGRAYLSAARRRAHAVDPERDDRRLVLGLKQV
jgi:hypothetical protein